MGWEEEWAFPLSLSEKECSCMSTIKRAYRYRCYPTDEQQQMLARTFGCARWIYNWALTRQSRAYQEGKHLSYGDLSAALPDLKQQPETAWLAEVSSVTLQQSLRHLERAFVNFFEGRTRYPRFFAKDEKKLAKARRTARRPGAKLPGSILASLPDGVTTSTSSRLA
jgi:transposase